MGVNNNINNDIRKRYKESQVTNHIIRITGVWERNKKNWKSYFRRVKTTIGINEIRWDDSND